MGSPVPFQGPKTCRLIGDSKSPVSGDVSVNGCLYISPVIDIYWLKYMTEIVFFFFFLSISKSNTKTTGSTLNFDYSDHTTVIINSVSQLGIFQLLITSNMVKTMNKVC